MDVGNEKTGFRTGSGIWIGLFSIAFVALVWVGTGFVSKLILLNRFSSSMEGVATRWGVVSAGEEKHFVFANYKGEELVGQYVFKRPAYRTFEAAEEAMEAMRSEKVTIWYKGKESVLEHSFPMKEGIQTGAAAALLLYFIFLRKYLSQFSN